MPKYDVILEPQLGRTRGRGLVEVSRKGLLDGATVIVGDVEPALSQLYTEIRDYPDRVKRKVRRACPRCLEVADYKAMYAPLREAYLLGDRSADLIAYLWSLARTWPPPPETAGVPTPTASVDLLSKLMQSVEVRTAGCEVYQDEGLVRSGTLACVAIEPRDWTQLGADVKYFTKPL